MAESFSKFQLEVLVEPFPALAGLDRKVLEQIILHRCLALIDLPLMGGQPNLLSRGIMVHDIPADTLRVIGIGPGYASNSYH